MFDHVTVRVSDRGESERFYAAVLAALDRPPTYTGEDLAEWNDFSLCQATRACPPTKRLHVAFAARSPEQVDAFWQSGTEAGFLDDGRPGPRPRYRDDYYGGFLRDPDGNSVEAVHHGDVRPGGIDHLWVRVADLDASRGFYELAAPHAGIRLVDEHQDRVRFAGDGGSMSLVDRAAHRGAAHRIRGERRRRGRGLPQRRHQPPATPTTGRPGSGRSTTTATTPPTCSIPTAPTSSS